MFTWSLACLNNKSFFFHVQYILSQHRQFSSTDLAFCKMSKRQAYDVNFKMEVLAVAEKCSNREAGRRFAIDESLVRRWRQNKSKLEEAYSQPTEAKKKKLGSGRKSYLPTFDTELAGRYAHGGEKQQNQSPSNIIQVWERKMAHGHDILGLGLCCVRLTFIGGLNFIASGLVLRKAYIPSSFYSRECINFDEIKMILCMQLRQEYCTMT